jgi:hypothetical protein
MTLVRSPGFTDKEERFWRGMILPEEDQHRFPVVQQRSGYRWFRSANVIPIEKYRRAQSPAGGRRVA